MDFRIYILMKFFINFKYLSFFFFLHILGVGKLQHMDQIWSTPSFCRKSVIGTQSHSFVYVLSCSCFYASMAEWLQQRPYGLKCPKYLPSGPLQIKVVNPWYGQWYQLQPRSLSKLNSLISFSYLIAWTKTFSTMLNNDAYMGRSCLISEFIGNTLRIS